MAKCIRKVMYFFKLYGCGMFLGIAVGELAGLPLNNWRWWAIVVPTIILICVRDEAKSNG